MTIARTSADKKPETKAKANAPRAIGDDQLEKVSGGAARKIIIVGG